MQPTDTVLVPRNDFGNVSDQNCVFKHINNIGKDILNLRGKLVVHHSQNGFNRNDVEDRQKLNNDAGQSKPGSIKTNQSLRTGTLKIFRNTPGDTEIRFRSVEYLYFRIRYV